MIGGDNSRRFRIAFNVLAVVSAAAVILAGWSLYARFAQTNQIRQANKRVWHAVICTIEAQIAKSRTLTDRQKQAQFRFYDRLLTQDVATTGCGHQ